MEFCYEMGFSIPKQPLESSYKMGDFWDCSGRGKKPFLLPRNTVSVNFPFVFDLQHAWWCLWYMQTLSSKDSDQLIPSFIEIRAKSYCTHIVCPEEIYMQEKNSNTARL